jgi:hypothetical protein
MAIGRRRFACDGRQGRQRPNNVSSGSHAWLPDVSGSSIDAEVRASNAISSIVAYELLQSPGTARRRRGVVSAPSHVLLCSVNRSTTTRLNGHSAWFHKHNHIRHWHQYALKLGDFYLARICICATSLDPVLQMHKPTVHQPAPSAPFAQHLRTAGPGILYGVPFPFGCPCLS